MAIESMEVSLIIKGEKLSIEGLGELSNYGKSELYIRIKQDIHCFQRG